MTNQKRPLFAFWTGIVLGGILATPAAYLLLLGPLAFLYLTELISEETWKCAGRPLLLWGYYVGEHPESFWSLYRECLNFWMKLAGVHVHEVQIPMPLWPKPATAIFR